jgi:Fe-S-cluster containining protein
MTETKPSGRPQLRTQSPYIINERIAYEGHVGRERKQWCEDFIKWKEKRIQDMSNAQASKVSETGKCISCSKACSFCCSQHIGATVQECDAIVYWLSQHPDVRERFLKRYPVWRSRIRQHEDVFQHANLTGNVAVADPFDKYASAEFMKAVLSYLKLDIPCPFLDDDGSCSIYPVRPLVCASLVVTSPPEYCKASSPEVPQLLLWKDSNEIQPPYFRGPKDKMIYSCAPLLVHEILHGGYIYLNDLPGFNGLESEALTDPEVRGILT